MDNSTYWICVDEKGYESVFTYEPHYNYLYGTWRNSFSGTYITKGMIKLLVDINFDTSNLKAYAIEVSKISLTNNILKNNSFETSTKEKIEKFLEAWYDNKYIIVLVRILKGCNVSNGYPYYVLQYHYEERKNGNV